MTPETLGQAISSQRKLIGLTQSDLAATLGVTRQLIGELERGKPGIRLQVALQACIILGLTLRVDPGMIIGAELTQMAPV